MIYYAFIFTNSKANTIQKLIMNEVGERLKSNYYTLSKVFILGVLISEASLIVGMILKYFYNLSLQSDRLYIFLVWFFFTCLWLV